MDKLQVEVCLHDGLLRDLKESHDVLRLTGTWRKFNIFVAVNEVLIRIKYNENYKY